MLSHLCVSGEPGILLNTARNEPISERDGETAAGNREVRKMLGMGRLLVPVVGLPITRFSAGVWVHLVAWLTVLSLAVLLTRYALLERYDPWVEPEVWANASH
jgi:hypothetical protein